MSTRATIASADHDGLHVHLYHELHDNCVHLTLSGDCYSAVDIVIPPWMVDKLGHILSPGSVPHYNLEAFMKEHG